jgi:high-affinity iron transporter
MYLGFLALPLKRVFSVTNVILVLIAAGMAARAANFLAQAGIVPSFGSRVWDSSSLISNQSGFGQFLGAMVGYIDRPSGIEVACYAGTVLVVVTLMRWTRGQLTRRTEQMG